MKLKTKWKKLVNQVSQTSLFCGYEFQDDPKGLDAKVEEMEKEAKENLKALSLEVEQRVFDLELMQRDLQRLENVLDSQATDLWLMNMRAYGMVTPRKGDKMEKDHLKKYWDEKLERDSERLMTEKRKFEVHGREFWLTKPQLANEVEPEDLNEVWDSLERSEH